MTESTLKRLTVLSVDGNSIVQVGDFPLAPPPPPPPPPPPDPEPSPDNHVIYANRQVTILPGENIQAKINANGAGTIYGLARGNHLSATTAGLFTPKAGDKFVGETDAAGIPLTFLKGNWDQTQTGGGVVSPFTGTLATGVEMARIDFSLYASGLAQCAMNSGTNWTYWKCYAHHNKSGAIRVGTGGLVFGGKVYNNGQVGFFCNHPTDGATIDGTEIFNNNLQGWSNPAWEAGGLKMIGPSANRPKNITIKNCFVHHNNGPGIWYDFALEGNQILTNTVEDNTRAGIFYEISEGWALIEGNTLRRNASQGNIFISFSAGVSGNPIIVRNNNVADSTGHAEIWLEDSAARPPHRLGWVSVLNNIIRRPVRTGMVNIATGHFGDTVVPPGIVINGNQYFTNIGTAWQWLGTGRTWTQWRALGFDTTGTLAPY